MEYDVISTTLWLYLKQSLVTAVHTVSLCFWSFSQHPHKFMDFGSHRASIVFCKVNSGCPFGRVHLQWLGHPIANDLQYGGPYKGPRPAYLIPGTAASERLQVQQEATETSSQPSKRQRLSSERQIDRLVSNMVAFLWNRAGWCSSPLLKEPI